MNLFQPNEKIKFPISFKLKIISISFDTDESAYSTFGKILKANKIVYSNWDHMPSNGGKYSSYRVDVTIKDEITFKKLYADLDKIDGVKCVI